MGKRYIPDVGDIILVHFDADRGGFAPQARSAMILSPRAYNRRTGLIVCCPIVAQTNNYPFEVLMDDSSAILSDQPKSLSWVGSRISFQGRVTPDQLAQVRAKLHALVFNA